MLELSRELMAGVALGLLWIHTLLIAAAAGLDLRDLGRLARARVRVGVVTTGEGPSGALARNVVAQIGRCKGDGVIHLHDAEHRSEVFGGVVELEDGSRVELAAASEAAVWPDLDTRARAAAVVPSDAAREQALHDARRARGWTREVAVALVPGDRVWLVDDGGRTLAVSGADPRAWLNRKRALVLGFLLAILAIAGGCSVAAYPVMFGAPLFGLVSMLGAAAALGFFLGVQPLGVAVTEAVRTPDRAYLRGKL